MWQVFFVRMTPSLDKEEDDHFCLHLYRSYPINHFRPPFWTAITSADFAWSHLWSLHWHVAGRPARFGRTKSNFEGDIDIVKSRVSQYPSLIHSYVFIRITIAQLPCTVQYRITISLQQNVERNFAKRIICPDTKVRHEVKLHAPSLILAFSPLSEGGMLNRRQ